MSDPFVSMVNHVYTALGRAAQYQERDDEEATDCRVIVSYDLTQWGDVIQVQNDMAMVSVRKSEIEDRPRRGDLFLMATGREYEVERVMVSDEYEHRVLTKEHEPTPEAEPDPEPEDPEDPEEPE
jgi:hypothetical protein